VSTSTISAPVQLQGESRAQALRAVARLARAVGWQLLLPPPGKTRGDLTGAAFCWAPEAAHLFGWPRTPQPLAHALLQFAPEDRSLVHEALAQCALRGQSFDLLAQALLPDGQQMCVRLAGQGVRDADGRITALYGAAQDVRESEERFQLVARATSDTIWDWNLLSDALWWSEGLQRLTGETRADLPPDSRSWTERLHPTDGLKVIEALYTTIAGTGQHWSAEYRFRRKDGSYAWVSDRGFVLRDAAGVAYRMVGGMKDISTHKQMELNARAEARAHVLLLQVQQQITRLDQPLQEALAQAAEAACELAGAEAALVALREGDALRMLAAVGAQPLPPLQQATPLQDCPPWLQLEALAGAPGAAAHATGEEHGRQFVAVPLSAGGELLGLVQVLAPPHRPLAQQHLAHLRILAESLAALVQLRRVEARLRASERQYRSLFAEHAQPMWVCERGSLRILAANRAMARHYGYDQQELLELDMRALWPPAQQAGVDAAVAQAGASHAPTLWRHQRRGGAPIDVEAVLGETEFDGRPAWQVLASDVTERCRMEDELARVNRARRMKTACSELLVRASSEDELLHAVCRMTVEIGGYSLAWVGMARSDMRRSIDIVASAGGFEDYVAQLHLSWSPADPRGRGPAGKALRSGQTVIVRDVDAASGFHSWSHELTRKGLHAVVCLPLKSSGESFGLLYLYAPEVLHIGQEETQLLEALAADLAYGIQGLRTRAGQQRLQSVLLKVAAAVSDGTGAQFFERLAQNMASALGAQIACVARLLPAEPGGPQRVATLSHVCQGHTQANGEYALEGTPSHYLLTHRQYVVADHAATLYPNAPLLARSGARSYVGQQLADRNGVPIGLLFVAYEQPLEPTQFVVNTLQIFAARATAELERQTADAHIRRQASLLDKARDAIIVRDLQHRVIYWNHSAERLYGWRSAEVLGRNVSELLYRDPSIFHHAMQATLREGEWGGEIVQYDREGRRLEVEGRWTLVRTDDGEPEAVLAMNTDIAQRKASEREIQRLAFFDALTGLPNRLQLMQHMERALLGQAREGGGGGPDPHGALLFIDLDNFKTLNDTLGHDMGDQLLQQVAERLRGCTHADDLIARIGGDEFVVLQRYPDITQLRPVAQALSLGEELLAVLAAPYTLGDYQARSTPSIGIAVFGDLPTSVGELLKQADMAMYQAKMAGRNTLRFFDPTMEQALAERTQLEADLREALAQGQFHLAYQPVMDSAGHVRGVEALTRWQHPGRDGVSPAVFIPLAEETGLILPLGRWVLHTACAVLAQWQREPRLAHLTMAVNVSSRQFRNAGFVDEVLRTLADTGAPARQLKLEITESLLVEDMQATIATMQALCAHGVGFSLDDFGTGYSSLAYLKRMPLAQLKIDQSFVRDLLTDPNDAAIVKTIIALASSLGLEAIAEGVETHDQHHWLGKAGCSGYQGYHFSRPLPLAQLEGWLRQRMAHDA